MQHKVCVSRLCGRSGPMGADSMSMSRRHFRKLAAAINETFEEMENDAGVEALMHRIMRVCRSENPNFDSGRFYSACLREVGDT